MTTISLTEILTQIYGKPVDAEAFRVISTGGEITLEVWIQPQGEQKSKTFVEITL